MKILYVKSNSNRNKKYQIQTIIYEENGKKFVKKRALKEESLAHLKGILKSYKILSKNIKKESIKLAPIASKDSNSITFEYIEGKSFWSKYTYLELQVDRDNYNVPRKNNQNKFKFYS